MYAPTHNTNSTQRTATCSSSYMYIHNYIYMYSIAQSETIYTNDHLWLKSVASITTIAKRNLARSHPKKKHATLCGTVRTYSDTMHEKYYNYAYNRLKCKDLDAPRCIGFLHMTIHHTAGICLRFVRSTYM